MMLHTQRETPAPRYSLRLLSNLHFWTADSHRPESTTRAIKVDVIKKEGSVVYRLAWVLRALLCFHPLHLLPLARLQLLWSSRHERCIVLEFHSCICDEQKEGERPEVSNRFRTAGCSRTISRQYAVLLVAAGCGFTYDPSIYHRAQRLYRLAFRQSGLTLRSITFVLQ